MWYPNKLGSSGSDVEQKVVQGKKLIVQEKKRTDKYGYRLSPFQLRRAKDGRQQAEGSRQPRLHSSAMSGPETEPNEVTRNLTKENKAKRYKDRFKKDTAAATQRTKRESGVCDTAVSGSAGQGSSDVPPLDTAHGSFTEEHYTLSWRTARPRRPVGTTGDITAQSTCEEDADDADTEDGFDSDIEPASSSGSITPVQTDLGASCRSHDPSAVSLWHLPPLEALPG